MDTDITDPSFKYAPSQNPIDPLKTSGSAALPNTMAQQVDFVPSGDDFADTIAKQTRQRIADQTNAMNLAISKAAAGNADEAAAAQRLGYETGVGADIAARNMKALQERVAVDRIGQLDLMRADPVLAKMLSDQNFAAIAHDDVDNLQSTGTMLDSVMGVKNEFLLGRERGYATTALGKTGGKMLQDSWLGKPLLEADRAEARRQTAEMEKMRGSGGFAESFGALEGQMESGLPGQIEMAGVGAVAGGAILGLPSGGLGLVPGMVAGAELGFLSASAVQSFEIESGASFVDLLDQDIPEDTARTAATIVGTINAALEMIPLKFFTSRAKSLIKSTVQEQVVSSLVQVPGIKNAVGKFVKEWTMGIGVESVTEVVQELTNMWGEDFSKYQTDPDFQAKMTTPEGRMEVANRLLSTFEEVAKGMAVMGFIMPGANFALDAKRARKANKAKQFFKDIGKDAAESKVRERNPNSYQAWFAARAKGTGAETIYVDVDKVRGAMVKNGINQEQLQFLLPDLYKQLQAIGANSGVDVTIPTSVYAARLVDTAFGQDLQSDMRLNPDDMSINDNNEYVKTRDRRVAELVKLSDEMTASDEILAESAKVVENRVVAEIMAVGKYTELEAKAMAAAHVAFAVVNAPEFGMTPDQFDTQYGMATRGEGQAVPTTPLEQANQFDQASRTDLGLGEQAAFNEANQRPEIVAWAKEKFGDRTAPDGSIVWQNFTEWFGDSKTVDAEGKPVMVYHGTDKKFTKVNMKKGAQGVFWVASDKAAIEKGEVGAARSGVIMELFVSIKNPAGWNEYDNKSIAELIRDGYDGVILRDKDGSFNAIAFTPTQIKSAGENVGTFSKTDASLLNQAAISKMNPKYMAAVKRGDMETAQQMVIDAANAAGYTTLAHHGTDSDPFDVFDTGDEYNWGQASYFSPNLEYATMYSEISRTGRGKPRVLNVALDLGKTFSPETNKEHLKLYRQWAREQERLKGHGAFFVNGPIKGPYGPTKARNVIDYQDQWWIVERIWEAGFHSFTTSESDGQTIAWGVRSPNQIKLIDPVTRDESGKIIPLSKRFNFKSPSILEQAAYRGEHTAPTNDGYAQPLNNLGGIFPDDIYSQDAARLYGTGNEQQDRQAISIIQSARGKPNQSIKIYRAVPLVLSNAEKIADIEKQKAEIQRRGYERWAKKQENPLTYDQLNAELDRLKSLPEEVAVVKPQINNGDWVTISKQYAVEHGESALNGNYKIVTKTVPVKHLFTDGNSIQEWGYDSTAQGILEQAAVPASTYSALDKAVGEVTAKSLAAAGWKEQIKGWVNKGIVKQSEVEWSGLVEYLDMQEGKITKETVSEFLKNNGVKVETVTLGDRGDLVDAATLKGIDKAEKDLTNLYKDDPTLKQEFDTYRRLMQENAPRDEIYAARFVIEERLQYPDTYSSLDTYIEQAYEDTVSDTSKYSMYVLPGGKNYREVLVTLPFGFAPPAPAMSKEGLAARQVVFDKYAPRLAEIEAEVQKYYSTQSTDETAAKINNAIGLLFNERDELETKRDAEANALYKIPSAPKAKPFMSSHWDESNVLVHLRMNDRTDADGKRVLFVEEVQSDWGQEGKKKGFAANPITIRASEARMEELKKQIIDITRQQSQLEANSEEWNILEVKSESIAQNYDDIYRRVNELKSKAISQAPFVETTDGWLNLGLKHVMLEAINGGYDRVAFVDGDQSVTRYKDALTEAVDEVEIDRNDDGTYNYKAIKDGKEVKAEESVTAERIEDLFGKSGGADLIEQADAFPNQINTIKSEDIKIGGEGMRKFYDDVLPAAMNKLLKKYGGEKLGQTKFAKSEGVKVKVKEISDSAVKLIRGDISIEEFRDETDLSVEDVSDSILEDVSTAIGDRSDRARIRQFANDFAQDIKQKLAGGKKMTQPSFDVTAAFIERVGQGLPLFQAMPSPGRRGSFDPTRLLTTLNTKADLSTFLHESSHFFFSVYTDIASRPGAPARIAADVQILLDSFGVKDIAAWNAMTFEEQRKYQEQFAYNFEIYLFEGKAPSIEMQGLFERFSKWLRRVYTSISTELNDIYRREFGEDLPILTDEIRGVMGRMLASEAQIKRAEAVNEMKPQFQTQAESGMDDARWAAYQAMIQEAHDQAVTDLTKASLRQMEWLSNARSRLLKNMQSKHDEIRKEMRAEIEAEVMAEPLYMAMSILKTGQGRAKNGELVQFNDKFKLNLEAVKKMLPSEEIAKLGYGKYGMVSEDGIPPDMVAEIVGFVSGDELVLALLTAKPAKEEIAARLDKRMMDEYGKMNTPEAREAAVQAAIHNEARERFVAVEARFIAKATQPVRVMIDAAKAAARQIVGAKKIDDISPGEYAAAEARASRDAAEAYKDRQTPDAASKSTYTRVYNEQIAAGVDEATAVAEATRKAADASTKAQGKADAYKAKYGDRTPEQVIIRAKQAQVLQNQLVKEAASSLEEVDTAVKDFRKFFGSDEKIAKSRNMDLVDAARAILSYYGFGKVDKNPADYIKKLEAYNPELYAEIAPLISQASTGVRDYTQMTMDDFRMLRDVVDALWAQSRRDKQITVAGKKIALDGVLSELDARLNEIGVPTTVPGEKSALTTKEKFAAHLYSAKALLRRVENWADATDGAGGVGAFTKYIYRPVKDAVNAYRVDRNNYVKRFVDLVSTLDLPVGKITSPELDYTFGVGNGGIGKAELLGAMLHTGNESNYKKLLIGRKWGEFNDDESVNTSRWDAFVGRMITEGVLTKEDFDFLQAVWDLNEEIKPIAQRAHRDLYGYYFKEVEATSFTNRFGTYRGGYVPAKTDAAIVRDAQRQAKAEELEADFRSSMPSTGMGFTKGRVEYNKPLSLDVRLMAKHIDDVLRFANIQPAIKDALRIVNNRAFADKLSSIDPTAVEFMLLPWLNRTARQSTNEPGRNKVIDNFWRTLRSRTGMSIMFANLRNALQQVTGLFPSALKVSKGALKDSLFAYLASPRKTAEAIAGLSPFMNERMHSQIFEIQDQMNDLLLNPSKFDKIQKWSQHHGYFLQSAFQNFVDIVTWNGKYNQVLSEIGTTLSDSEAQAEAIQQADAAVRSTQGSMSAEDVAAFEVGSPFYKTFVQFTGYFNMLANLNTDEYVKVLRDLGWRGNKGKLVSIYMLGFLAPTLVADAIARSLGAGWDDDDDGYLDDVADWFFGSQVRAGAAMVPFGSAAYTAFAAGFTARTYDDRITSSPSIGSLEASTVGVGKAVVNLASDDKELTDRNVRDVLTLITNATGVPVSVLGRPIGYQMEVNRGKVEPTDPIDYMRGLITGVPSAESKKK